MALGFGAPFPGPNTTLSAPSGGVITITGAGDGDIWRCIWQVNDLVVGHEYKVEQTCSGPGFFQASSIPYGAEGEFGFTSIGTATNPIYATFNFTAQPGTDTYVSCYINVASPRTCLEYPTITDLDAGLTITGALFTNSNTFGTNVVTTSTALTGALYTNPDTFGTNVLTMNLVGTLYSNPDTFGSGALTATFPIIGTLYNDADTFGVGTLTLNIIGTLFNDPDTFGGGSVTQGQIITGVFYDDLDTFGIGKVDLNITGTISTSLNVFYTGAISIGVTGTLYNDTDAFGSGVITQTSNAITGQLYMDPDQFFNGVVTGGEITSGDFSVMIYPYRRRRR